VPFSTINLELLKSWVERDDLYERRLDPFGGRKVQAVPIRTILRGKTVMENGKSIGKPNDGEHVKPLG